MTESDRPALHPLLVEVLACPACHGPLDVGTEDLTCAACRLAYPIHDGVPVLLVDEGVPTGTKSEASATEGES